MLIQTFQGKDIIMVNKRKYERFQISFFLRILDKDTDKAMGHVVDISVSGMRVLTDRPVSQDRDYTLAIDLTKDINFEQEVIFTSKCVWIEQDLSSGAYNCGFQLQNVTEKDQAIILKLIELFGE